MQHACTPILVGVAFPVSEIPLLSKSAKFSFRTMGYIQSMGVKKFNCLESAQKIHVSRGGCNMHLHQFWWAWPLQFRRYYYFQKWPNFPFGPWAIVHGCQKIQSLRIGSKNSCKQGQMCNTCTPILVGVAFLVLEILLLSKQPNFPFGPWAIVHGCQKI